MSRLNTERLTMAIECVKCFTVDHEKGITLANRSVEVSSGVNLWINLGMNAPIFHINF
jgi:hypothetical protein